MGYDDTLIMSKKRRLQKRRKKDSVDPSSRVVLGERLKYLRENRRFSQKSFAEAAGLSQSTVAQIETGRKDPSVKTLQKIAACLDVDIATLFATKDVQVFDIPRLRRKYKQVDDLNATIYMSLGKVVQYARDIGFLR